MSTLNEFTNSSIHFEVEAIIDHKMKSSGSIEYLLKWKDFNDEENSWIDEEDINAPSLIRRYWSNRSNKNKMNIVKRKVERAPKKSNNRGRRSSKKNVNTTRTIKETSGSDNEKNTSVNDGNVHMINDDDSDGRIEDNINIPQWLKTVVNEEGERLNHYFKPYAHGNWETFATILNVVREVNTSEIFVNIKWPDGTDSYHISKEVYQRCPLKLIQFYEKHLVIKN